MKKLLCLVTLILGIGIVSSAMTYEEAFAKLKTLAAPQSTQPVDTVLPGAQLGPLLNAEDVRIFAINREDGPAQTKYYGNAIYEIMGQLPVSEIANSHIGQDVLYTVYVKPSTEIAKYQMLVLYSSAPKGFTYCILTQIDKAGYDLVKNARIIYDGYGNIGLYTELFGFGAH